MTQNEDWDNYVYVHCNVNLNNRICSDQYSWTNNNLIWRGKQQEWITPWTLKPELFVDRIRRKKRNVFVYLIYRYISLSIVSDIGLSIKVHQAIIQNDNGILIATCVCMHFNVKNKISCITGPEFHRMK